MTKEEYQANLSASELAGFIPSVRYINAILIKDDYITSLEAENASIKKALEKAAKSLYKSTQSCPRDMFDWEHPATCDIECNTHSHVDDAWKCWLDWLMGMDK